MFWFFGHKACGILIPWPEIKPVSSALEGEILTTLSPLANLLIIMSYFLVSVDFSMAFDSITNTNLILSESPLWPNKQFYASPDGSLMRPWPSRFPGPGILSNSSLFKLTHLPPLLRRQRAPCLVLLFHIYTCLPLFSSSHLVQEELFFQISRLYLLSKARDSISSLLWVLVSAVITLPIILLPLRLPRCSGYTIWKVKQKLKQVNTRSAWLYFPFFYSIFFMFFYFKLPISSLSLYDPTTSKLFPFAVWYVFPLLQRKGSLQSH